MFILGSGDKTSTHFQVVTNAEVLPVQDNFHEDDLNQIDNIERELFPSHESSDHQAAIVSANVDSLDGKEDTETVIEELFVHELDQIDGQKIGRAHV